MAYILKDALPNIFFSSPKYVNRRINTTPLFVTLDSQSLSPKPCVLESRSRFEIKHLPAWQQL